MMKIDGRETANKIFAELKKRVEKLKEKNLIPHLAVILVGNDPASISYVNQKEIRGKRIGVKITVKNLPSNTTQPKLLSTIEQLNNNNNIHGIIVQRPLPKNIDSKLIRLAIDPKKDVDGFHPNSKFQAPIALAVLRILKEIYWKKSEIRNPKSETISNDQNDTRCHPEGAKRLKDPMGSFAALRMTHRVNFDIVSSFARSTGSGRPERESKDDIRISNFITWLSSKKIIIIGKGETGGRPIIEMLRKMKIEPQVIDSKTKNPQSLTKKADIIISAVGKPEVIKPEMIKRGVILIGVGLHKGKDSKLHGDYDEGKIKNIASFYTPTPGGVGPLNVAMLLKNLVTAAEN